MGDAVGEVAGDGAAARVATADRVLNSVGGGLHSATAAVAAKQAAAAASETEELAKRRRRAEASAARLAAVDKESKRKDWTANYRAWDEWEDPEEVEELERAAQAKSESAAKRAQYGGCSHDHSAERAVYDELWLGRERAARRVPAALTRLVGLPPNLCGMGPLRRCWGCHWWLGLPLVVVLCAQVRTKHQGQDTRLQSIQARRQLLLPGGSVLSRRREVPPRTCLCIAHTLRDNSVPMACSGACAHLCPVVV